VLPAFEAAARLASFRAAAEELHLTPSAISHQIRLLEEAVGVALFLRVPRGLTLTEAGRQFAATVREALLRLETEADGLVPRPEPNRLRVSLPDFVAHLHVLPALSQFRSRHPHIDLEISATMELADVEAGEADAAVRFGPGQWGKLRSYPITELVGTVVAAPELAAQAHALSERGELPMVCLHQLEEHTRKTLSSVGLRGNAARALRVDSYMALVQAARAGLGVAVVYGAPSKPRELDGSLVALSSDDIAVPFAMYFVCRQHESERPDLAALRSWLVECLRAQFHASGAPL